MLSYKNYSKATICRHTSKPLDDIVVDKRKADKGRPSKLTDRDCRQIIQQVVNLRKTGGHFRCKRVKLISGLSQVSDETV